MNAESPQLRDPMSGSLVALRERLDLVWASHEREHVQHAEAHTREHSFSQKAIDTAALLAKENKADANEWRAAMNDRERTFATKVDIGNISEQIDDLKTAELRRVERESERAAVEAQERRVGEQRQARSLWVVGLIVGILASLGSTLFGVLLRMFG